jgi:hypothetical protein
MMCFHMCFVLCVLPSCRRRPTAGVANPRGGDRPYLSPEGCHVVDVRFYEGLKLFGEDAEVSAAWIWSDCWCL